MATDLATLQIPVEGYYIVQGDTIPKVRVAFDALDNIDLTGATIKMQVYNKNEKFIDISTTDGGITLIDDKIFEIDEVAKENNTYPVGTWEGDLEITFADGKRYTYLKVQYIILKQYTK